MGTAMWGLLGVAALAGVVAESRRGVPVQVSSGLWVGMLTVAGVAWSYDRSEPWAALFTATNPVGAMLGLASALLALLIFAVDFFSNLAGTNKDPERFHGRPVDTYLSSRAPLTAGMYTVTFQAFTIALFVLPVVKPGVSHLHGGASHTLTALWIGCFGVVSALLLLATSYGLRTTLMRLRWRGNIYTRIIRDIHDEAQRDLRSLLLDYRTPLDAEQWATGHIHRLDTLPPGQQGSYLRNTLGKWGLELAALTALTRADALKQSRGLRARRTWIGERLHGHFPASKADDTARIHEQLIRTLTSCCRALARSSNDELLSTDVRVVCRERLLQLALWVDNYAYSYLQNPTLASSWLAPRDGIRPLDRDAYPFGSMRLFRGIGDDRGPQLISLTYAAFSAIGRSLFPADEPSSASEELTRTIIRSAAALSHKATATVTLAEITRAALRNTVASRYPDEALPLTLLRDTFVGRHSYSVSPQQHNGRDIGAALTDAAFTLSLDAAVMPIDQRSELLAYLDHARVCASLLHLLQYRHHDSSGTICSDDLVPYQQRLGHLAYDADHDRARTWLMATIDTLGTIGHFTGPADIDWLFDSLALTDPAELVLTHLKLQHTGLGHLPLRTLLLWRGLLGGHWYDRGDLNVRERLDVWQYTTVTSSVREVATLLEPCLPERSAALRWAFPWTLSDEAAPSPSTRSRRPRRGSGERPRIPSWKAAL